MPHAPRPVEHHSPRDRGVAEVKEDSPPLSRTPYAPKTKAMGRVHASKVFALRAAAALVLGVVLLHLAGDRATAAAAAAAAAAGGSGARKLLPTTSAPSGPDRCNPAPWLGAPDASAPWRGLENDFEALLAAQARPLGGGKYRAVSLVFFNVAQAVMMQNCVYSLVKYGGVCGYVVVTWDARSLAACAAMNLPCLNATGRVPGRGMGGDGAEGVHEAELHTGDYNKITWMKPVVVRDALAAGYAVHATDVDVAYFPSDLLASYFKFIDEAGADAAFQREVKSSATPRGFVRYVVNTGNFMVLPTARGLELARVWAADARRSVAEGNHDQFGLGRVYHERGAFLVCQAPWSCEALVRARAARQVPDRAIVRRTHNAWGGVFGDNCAPRSPGVMLYPAAPCHYPHAYLHAVCVVGAARKAAALKAAGFWFMDDVGGRCPEDAGAPGLVRCRPLAERLPAAEADFLACDRTRLSFRYFQGHAGVALGPALPARGRGGGG